MPRDDLRLHVPASATVLFPRRNGSAPSAVPHVVNVSLASLALPEFSGVTGFDGSHVLRTSAVAVYSGLTATNSGELDALADQASRDWYRNQLSARDLVVAGFCDLTIDGLVDRVELHHEPDHAATRVLRGFQGDSGGACPCEDFVLPMHSSGGSAGFAEWGPVTQAGGVWLPGTQVDTATATVNLYESTEFHVHDSSSIQINEGGEFHVNQGGTVFSDEAVWNFTQTTINVVETIIRPGDDSPITPLEIRTPVTFNEVVEFHNYSRFDGPLVEFDADLTFTPAANILVLGEWHFRGPLTIGGTFPTVISNLLQFIPIIPGGPPAGIDFGGPVENVEEMHLFRPPVLAEGAADPTTSQFPPGAMWLRDGVLETLTEAGTVTGVGSSGARTEETLAAAGTDQATATQITADGVVVTGADGTKGVRLPNRVAAVVIVWNSDASGALLVYPPVGAQISALGTDTAAGVAALKGTIYSRVSSTQWVSTETT